MRRAWPLGLVLTSALAQPTAGAETHWAWRPPERPAVPTQRDVAESRNPIDAFLGARLDDAGLPPAAPATREQLIRRMSFDLLGLPPTPGEIAAFLNDADPDAYEKVVDRSLASPAYGERWGRHWLDLARYADTNGYEHDEVREHAWKYRDYVIRSLNGDKPYDRFVREQLAGDELFPEDRDARIATGFNLLGPDMTDAESMEQRRQNTLDDMTDTAGLVFLGMTLACARCHDHKFEPIPQTDYYRLQAFFTPAEFRKDFTLARGKGKPPATFVLHRGELTQPGAKVHPGSPEVLTPALDSLPKDDDRRSALAEWLMTPENPLTGRVMVNRLWQHHFGKGIVATPSDFGVRGQRPTHPELLDWLAVEFASPASRYAQQRGRRADTGWSLKRMQRTMMLSAAYRRSSSPDDKAFAEDPGNKLLARMNRKRLEGEAVRDAVLSVAGNLNRQMFGAGVFPPLPEEMTAGGIGGWKPDPDPANHVRRSVYIFSRRNMRYPFLEVFDFPDSNLSCPKRERSTTAPQSLALLNSAVVGTAADALAARLQREAGTTEDRVALAYRLTLGREPTTEEAELAADFLRDSPLREFCRAMFNLNEFVYVD